MQDSASKRILLAYVVLLMGIWALSVFLGPGSPVFLSELIFGLRWLTTIPLIIGGVGAGIYFFGVLLATSGNKQQRKIKEIEVAQANRERLIQENKRRLESNRQ